VIRAASGPGFGDAVVSQAGAASGVVFRPATPADREGILAVAAKLPSNWIPYALDEGLSLSRGGFFVTEIAGRVVAICQAYLRHDGAWLEAMRVDPEFQGRGLATGLTSHVLEACAKWGCRRARLSTAVTNAPVHHFVGTRLGFRPLGRWVYVDEAPDLSPIEAGPLTGGLGTASLDPGPVRTAGPADLESVWVFLAGRYQAQRIRPAWLLSRPDHPWRLLDLTREELGQLLGEGWVLISEALPDSGRSPAGPASAINGVAFAAVHPEDPFESGRPGWACVSFLEGSAKVMISLLDGVLAAARRMPTVRTLDVSLPESQWDVFATLARPEWLGCGPSLDAVIYEKDLTPGGPGRLGGLADG